MERTAISDLYVRGIRISREIPQGSYLNTLPVVRYLKEQDELILSSRITFFVGENGVGKSTLMEALAISMGFNPEGGSANFRFSTMDSHSDLHKYLTAIKGMGPAARTVFSCGRKAFITWLRTSTGWTGNHPWAGG